VENLTRARMKFP